MSGTARAATPADVPVLVRLMEEFYAEADYPLDRQWAAASFEALLRSPALGSAWLLLDRERPAGYVVLTVRFSMEYGGLDAFVDDLFVRRAHRRRGLGHRALEALFDECARRGVLAVHVVVGSDNGPAQALYARFGFEAARDGRQTLSTRIAGAPSAIQPSRGSLPDPA